MSKRRKFTPEFKAKVVLAILTGNKSTAEVCREYQLREQLIGRWKNEFIENAAMIFENGNLAAAPEQERIADLERMVGRLTMENEILKKASLLLKPPTRKSGR
jgi:transposase-like protein